MERSAIIAGMLSQHFEYTHSGSRRYILARGRHQRATGESVADLA